MTLGSGFEQAKQFKEMAGNVGGEAAGFKFPLLDNPQGFLQILLGKKDVSLFEYTMPELRVEAPFKVTFPIYPPFLTGFFGGRIGAAAQFTFGFDTSGIFAGNTLDGFYIKDVNSQGKDIAEASIYGMVEVGAKGGLQFYIFDVSAGAAGGIYTTIGLNLNDPNHDGKVHLPELSENLSRGVDWLFDLDGEFGAFLRGFIKISFDLGFTSVTIVDARLSSSESSSWNSIPSAIRLWITIPWAPSTAVC